MPEEKMSLIEELRNPPRLDGGRLDEDKVINLMRIAADALSTMIGVAARGGAVRPRDESALYDTRNPNVLRRGK